MSSESHFKTILGTIGVMVVFGFLALILSGFAGRESVEERAYRGEFSAETTAARWKNLEDTKAAQSEVYNAAKVAEALVAVGKAKVAPAKTDIVVPGSPTFLKQMEQQSAPPTPPAGEAPVEGGDAAGGDKQPEAKPEAPAEPAPAAAEDAKPEAKQ